MQTCSSTPALPARLASSLTSMEHTVVHLCVTHTRTHTHTHTHTQGVIPAGDCVKVPVQFEFRQSGEVDLRLLFIIAGSPDAPVEIRWEDIASLTEWCSVVHTRTYVCMYVCMYLRVSEILASRVVPTWSCPVSSCVWYICTYI